MFRGRPHVLGRRNAAQFTASLRLSRGDQLVGTVAEIDDEAASRWGVRVGNRVVAEQIVPCEECRYCRLGQIGCAGATMCSGSISAHKELWPSTWRYRPWLVFIVLAPSCPPLDAAFAEPLSCSLHAVERGDISFDDVVVVAGVGPIGLGMVVGAKLRHPLTLVVVDNYAPRLEVAKACGADLVVNVSQEDPVSVIQDLTDGYGCDVYFEATGHPSGVAQGLSMLRKAGRFVEYSVMREPATVDWTVIGDSKELEVRGAHLGPYCWPPAIGLLEGGSLPMDRIVTHQLPVEDFAHGLGLVADGRESVKVSLVGF